MCVRLIVMHRYVNASSQFTNTDPPCKECVKKIKEKKQEIFQRREKIRNTTDHLIWMTARLLSSAGREGTVFFPINLCGPFKKGQFQHNQEEVRTCRFAQCLKKTKELCGHTGAYVDECREDQTSSWCTKCYSYCGYLGASNTFHCPNANCKYVFGRDEAAARSIMVFTLMKNAVRSVTRACGNQETSEDGAEPSLDVGSSNIMSHAPFNDEEPLLLNDQIIIPQTASGKMSGKSDNPNV